MKLVATDTSGNIWYGDISGTAWSNISPQPAFSCVTSNENGTFLAATDSGENLDNATGDVWVSNNAGVSWVTKDSNIFPQHWASICYEPVGENLIAVPYGGTVFPYEGLVYKTSSSGATFVWSDAGPDGYGGANLTSISCSKTTSIVVLTIDAGLIQLDDGFTGWGSQTDPPAQGWTCSAISSDGSRIFVGAPLTTPSGNPASGTIWRYIPGSTIPTWEEKIDIGAVAAYIPANNIWVLPNPPSIRDAIDRMAAAYYTKFSVDIPVLP
jgi:hypothetical protein